MANRETKETVMGTQAQSRLTMAQINGPIPFTALWDNTPKTYDPRIEGFFAVVNLSGRKIDLGISEQGYQQSLSLSYGSVGTPRATRDQAVADLALTIARFPEAQSYLSIVRLPAVLTSRDGWVDVDYTIPMDVLHEATAAADKDRRSGDRFWGRTFERKHKLTF
jgi:hypothetical protein